MSVANLSHIRGIIWDLDNTLYRYDDLFLKACHRAAANVAVDMGLNMTLEDAEALATKSYNLHENSFRLFAEHGLSYQDFHFPFHDTVDITILQKNLDMKIALEKIDLPMAVLTNASKSWAKRTLEHLEISHIFGDGKVISLEDVNFKPKAHHTDGFIAALEAIGTTAEQTLLVEDVARNLPLAKGMGLTTALVHHGKIPEGAAGYVDMFYQTTLDLIQDLLES